MQKKNSDNVDRSLTCRAGKSFAEKKASYMDLPTQIQNRLDTLGVLARDVEERFVRGSGPGGQKINKTSSTVCLRHGPTQTEVRVQRERSQAANRELAWQQLCEKLEAQVRAATAQVRAAREKLRRKNRRRSRAQKTHLVAQKRQHSQVKATRGRVAAE
jgi:protein subunit release factor B